MGVQFDNLAWALEAAVKKVGGDATGIIAAVASKVRAEPGALDDNLRDPGVWTRVIIGAYGLKVGA